MNIDHRINFQVVECLIFSTKHLHIAPIPSSLNLSKNQLNPNLSNPNLLYITYSHGSHPFQFSLIVELTTKIKLQRHIYQKSHLS